MTNVILINGHSYDNVKNSLELWLSYYADNKDLDGSQFELYTKKETEFIIKADEKLPNEYFAYLVNYLTYPEGLDGRMIVTGYTKITDENFFLKEFAGTAIMLFIPEDDTEHDTVYWVTEQNKVYKTSFKPKTIPVDPIRKFEQYDINLSVLEPPEIIEYKDEDYKEPEVVETEKDRTRWIKFLAIATAIGFLFSFAFYKDPRTFTKMVEVVGFALTYWFFLDYKTLRINKFYNYSLLIALAVSLFGILIVRSDILFKYLGNVELFSSLPVLFLISQKIVRLVFIRIFKREPAIEISLKKFFDFIYIIFLIATTIFVCALIF
jgi:hypothetical protein